MGHRVLEGEQTLLRIFLGESDQWHGRPLHLALIERLRKEGAAGVTVLRGIAGFGARSVVHTTHILRLSEDLPIVLELVDTPEHVERLLPSSTRWWTRPGDDGEGPGGEVRTRGPPPAP
jgi:PII-like signaling protein